MFHLYRNDDQKYLWVQVITTNKSINVISRSVCFDRKKDAWVMLKRISEELVVNELFVIDHTFDISKCFRYKQTPIGVLKSGQLYFTMKDHPLEYKEILTMKNYPVNDLLYWE
jgi:hypothetical protein